MCASYNSPAVPSGPPTSLMTSSSNPRSITLTWGSPQEDQRNGILRYYLVTLTSTLPTITRNISSTITSITVGGLRPFTSYTCTVSVATVGVGPSTTGQTIVTQEDGMYVCLDACMYVCLHACMYVCLYYCMYVCENACMCAYFASNTCTQKAHG